MCVESWIKYCREGNYLLYSNSYTLTILNFNIFRILDEITACIKAIKKYLLDKGFLENKLRHV